MEEDQTNQPKPDAQKKAEGVVPRFKRWLLGHPERWVIRAIIVAVGLALLDWIVAIFIAWLQMNQVEELAKRSNGAVHIGAGSPSRLYQDLNGDGRGNPRVTYDTLLYASPDGFVPDSTDHQDQQQCLFTGEDLDHLTWIEADCPELANEYPAIEVPLVSPSGERLRDKTVLIYTPEGWSDLVRKSILPTSLLKDESGSLAIYAGTGESGVVRLEFQVPEQFSAVELDKPQGLGLRFLPEFGDETFGVEKEIRIVLCKKCIVCLNN